MTARGTNEVVEIIDLLVDGDWERFETEQGRTYFIVGQDAWNEEQCRRHGIEFVPGLRGRFSPSILGEHTVRGEVAQARPTEDHLKKARQRLEGQRVQPGFIDAFVAFMNGEAVELSKWPERKQILVNNWDAFSQLLDALMLPRIARGEALPDPEERSRIELDRERLFLKELGRMYPKLLDRSARLAALTFEDEQLAEASRCYLYGFWRATVVLSATALDTNLSDRVNPKRVKQRMESIREDSLRTGYFRALVDEAVDEKLLGEPVKMGQPSPYAEKATLVFSRRNGVVHKSVDPGLSMAEEVLIKARTVIEYLREAPQRQA